MYKVKFWNIIRKKYFDGKFCYGMPLNMNKVKSTYFVLFYKEDFMFFFFWTIGCTGGVMESGLEWEIGE